jgi:hypothetical protein
VLPTIRFGRLYCYSLTTLRILTTQIHDYFRKPTETLAQRKHSRKGTAAQKSIVVIRFYTTDSGYYDSSKTVDGLFAVLASRNNTSLVHVMSGSEQLSINTRCDNVAILNPFFSAHQATGHPPSCLNPTVVTFTILSLIRGSQYYGGKQRCPQDRRRSMPLWKAALFFLLFLLTEGWMNEGEQQASKTRVFVIHPTVGIICSCPDWSRPHLAAVQPFIHFHELRARRK